MEFFPRLLPRQLDEEGAKILQNIIEKKFSFEFYLGVKAQKIIGSKRFEGIELEDGRKIMGDMLIVSAGIIPHIEVAKISLSKEYSFLSVINIFLWVSTFIAFSS